MSTWQPYHDWPRDDYDSATETVRNLRLDEAALEIANQRALDADEQANRIVLGMAGGAGR